MKDNEEFRKMEEEDILLGDLEQEEVVESTLKELDNWKRNEVFTKVKGQRQKAVTTKWVVMEKMKGGKRICKVLVARKKEWGLKTVALTCSLELQKLQVTKDCKYGT